MKKQEAIKSGWPFKRLCWHRDAWVVLRNDKYLFIYPEKCTAYGVNVDESDEVADDWIVLHLNANARKHFNDTIANQIIDMGIENSDADPSF